MDNKINMPNASSFNESNYHNKTPLSIDIPSYTVIRSKLKVVQQNTFPEGIYQIDQCIETDVVRKKSDDGIDMVSAAFSVHDDLFDNNKMLCDIIKLPIEPEYLEQICFEESLIISLKMDNEEQAAISVKPKKYKELLNLNNMQAMGGMVIKLENIDETVKTYVAAEFSYNGIGANSKIFAIVDHNLNCIKEKHVQALCYPDKKIVCIFIFLFIAIIITGP